MSTVSTGGPPEELQRALRALEVGDWRSQTDVRRAKEHLRAVAHPSAATRLGGLVRLVARSQQLHARGEVHDAWDRLDEAARSLPVGLRTPVRLGRPTLAVLAAEPQDPAWDVTLMRRAALLIWRDQTELADLQRRFVPGSVRPRDELVEACIEHLAYIDFDPFSWYRPELPPAADGTCVSRERSVLCVRATRLRQFADPTAGRLSQAVWQDIGGYRGLCAEALDRVAARPGPAPWCGIAGTSGLTVRYGLLRLWEHARRRRADRDYWP